MIIQGQNYNPPSSTNHFVSQFLFCCFKQHRKTFKAASFEELGIVKELKMLKTIINN